MAFRKREAKLFKHVIMVPIQLRRLAAEIAVSHDTRLREIAAT